MSRGSRILLPAILIWHRLPQGKWVKRFLAGRSIHIIRLWSVVLIGHSQRATTTICWSLEKKTYRDGQVSKLNQHCVLSEYLRVLKIKLRSMDTALWSRGESSSIRSRRIAGSDARVNQEPLTCISHLLRMSRRLMGYLAVDLNRAVSISIRLLTIIKIHCIIKIIKKSFRYCNHSTRTQQHHRTTGKRNQQTLQEWWWWHRHSTRRRDACHRKQEGITRNQLARNIGTTRKMEAREVAFMRTMLRQVEDPSPGHLTW